MLLHILIKCSGTPCIDSVSIVVVCLLCRRPFLGRRMRCIILCCFLWLFLLAVCVKIASVQLVFLRKPIWVFLSCGSMYDRNRCSNILLTIFPVWLSNLCILCNLSYYLFFLPYGNDCRVSSVFWCLLFLPYYIEKSV